MTADVRAFAGPTTASSEGAVPVAEDDRPEATERLYESLFEWTCRYIGLTDEFRVAFVAWCMGTWVYQTFASYPYLRLFGPPGTGKSTVLDVAVALCWRPKATLAYTPAVLFRQAAKGMTLILDEVNEKPSGAVLDVLRGGFSRDRVVVRNDPTKDGFVEREFHIYGPKLIAGQAPLDDPALESRCIVENMALVPPKESRTWPPELPRSFYEEKPGMRVRLGKWAAANANMGHDGVEFPDGMESRAMQVFLPILAIAPQKHHEAAHRLIRRHQARVGRDSADTLEVRVLQSLVDMGIGNKQVNESFYPGDVANKANEAAGVSDKHSDALTGRKVSTALSRLGFKRGRHTPRGNPFLCRPGQVQSLVSAYCISADDPDEGDS